MDTKGPTKQPLSVITKGRPTLKESESYSPVGKKYKSTSVSQIYSQEGMGNTFSDSPTLILLDQPDSASSYLTLAKSRNKLSSLPPSPTGLFNKHNDFTNSMPRIMIASNIYPESLRQSQANLTSAKHESMDPSLLQISDKGVLGNNYERPLRLPNLSNNKSNGVKLELPKISKNSLNSMPSSPSYLKAENSKNKSSLDLAENLSFSSISPNSRSQNTNKTSSAASLMTKTRNLSPVKSLNSSLLLPDYYPNNLEKLKNEVLRGFRPHRGAPKRSSIDLLNNFENNHHLDQILEQRNEVVRKFTEKFQTSKVALVNMLPTKQKVRIGLKKKPVKNDFQPDFSNYSEFNAWTQALTKENRRKQLIAKGLPLNEEVL